MRKGYVQLYTGEGKGKTTAAFGLAFRAAGAGLRVYVAQFTKATEEGLHTSVERFADRIVLERFGCPHFIRGEPSAADMNAAAGGLARALEATVSGEYEVVVLDEICVALHYRLVQLQDVLDLIRLRPPHVEVVLTGRDAPPGLVEAADLVTEMRLVKHYYARGVKARRGIER